MPALNKTYSPHGVDAKRLSLVTAYLGIVVRFWLNLLVCLPMVAISAQSTQWQNLAKGIDYAVIAYNQPYITSKIHALKINPSLYSLGIASASQLERRAAHVTTYAKWSNSLIAINGGFFSPDYEPLGLRISSGKLLNPMRQISWWGIFTLKNNQPAIVSNDQYQADNSPEFAIQSGPRLLQKGQVVSNIKELADTRSALCINKTGQIVIIVTEHLPLTPTVLANRIRRTESQGGLSCQDAINLDGGHSSQLYAKIGETIINIPNLSPVADAIIVRPQG